MINHASLAIASILTLAAAGSVPAAPQREARSESPRAAWAERFQESRRGPEQTERIDATYTVGRGGALDVTNVSGDVRVTAGGGDAVRIEAVKRVRHRDADEARRLLRDLRVEITHVANRVEVRTHHPGMRGSGRTASAGVDFAIRVPDGARVAVRTMSGDVSVTGVRGDVRAETVSGDVEVTSAPSLEAAKTVSGNVTVRQVGGTSVSLGTVSGDVVADDLEARALEASTVSGGVRLSGVRTERLHAKTVSGDIVYDAPLTRGSRYEFNAHSGSVRLILSGDTGFEIDASSFSGSIRSDFPVTLRSTGSSRRRTTVNTVRGTYGDAGAIINVHSFSGSIVIVRK